MVWFFPSLLRETFTSLRGSTTLKHFPLQSKFVGFRLAAPPGARLSLTSRLWPVGRSCAGCRWWAGVVQVEDNWWAARWFATPRETGSPLAVTSPHTHLDNWKRRCRGTKIGEGVDHPKCNEGVDHPNYCYGICRWNNAQGRIRNRGKVAPAQTMPASY